MQTVLTILAICFAGFFLLNVYFRVRIFKHYRVLITQRVDFRASDIFSDERMTAVIDKYPHAEHAIRQYCINMRRTVRMASVFVSLVIVLGIVLLRNR